MTQNQHPPSEVKKVLTAETKYKLLLDHFLHLEEKVVRSIRLDDPSLDSSGALLRWNQGKVNLLAEIRTFIEALDDGTVDRDANRIADFLAADQQGEDQ